MDYSKKPLHIAKILFKQIFWIKISRRLGIKKNKNKFRSLFGILNNYYDTSWNFFGGIVSKKYYLKWGSIFTYARHSSIPQALTRRKCFIHKGKHFRKIILNRFHAGRKLGEFAFTRKPFYFTTKIKKKFLKK